ASRLAQARLRLQCRLAQRGITLSAVLTALALSAAARAAVPVRLAAATVRACCQYALNPSAAAGLVSAAVAALVKGATQTWFAFQGPPAPWLLLVAGALAAGSGTLLHWVLARPPAAPDSPITAAADSSTKPAVPPWRTPRELDLTTIDRTIAKE